MIQAEPKDTAEKEDKNAVKPDTLMPSPRLSTKPG
jgi:hypothetical protein